MKSRLVIIAVLVTVLSSLGACAFNAARKSIPARPDYVTVENGLEVYHFTVTAKRETK